MRLAVGFWCAIALLSLAACGDDDGGAGSGGAGSGGAGSGGDACDTCAICQSNDDCDDGRFCTGEETCDPDAEGADDNGCVHSEPPSCADDSDCTTDACDNDTDACTHLGPDLDEDGHRDADCLNDQREPAGDDCDDSDDNRYPGNLEVCDTHDEDCDASTIGFKDNDGDQAIDRACLNIDEQGTTSRGGDCNDENIAQHEGQPEFCDNVDNDCDGTADNGTVDVPWYTDADGDGFGDANDVTGMLSCSPIVGRALLNTDCDDSDITLQPAQIEACDAIDNNCNGAIDERLLGCASTEPNEPAPVNECLNNLDNCNDATQRCVDTRTGYSCVAIGEPALPCSTNNGGCGDPLYYTCTDGGPGEMRTCTDINECDDGNHGGCDVDQACIDIPGGAPICVNEVACEGETVITDAASLSALASRGCTRLTGSLVIDGTMLSSLAGLETIRWIEGALIITNNPMLTSGAGLANLVRVGGYMAINTNGQLTDLGLTSLRTVSGYVDILGNASLPDLDGLNALTRCEGGFSIWDNPALTNTSALTSLQYAGGNDGLSIRTNGSLATLSFPALREVSHFGVVYNLRLTSLGSFPLLAVVTGDIIIYGGNGLTSLNALGAITTIGGSVSIGQNGALRSLNGINVRTIGGNLEIDDNPELGSISGFANLTRVSGNVTIANHAQLANINGFTSLVQVGGLSIHHNPMLTRIGGFGALETVDGSLLVAANPALIELDAMDSLASVGLDLRVEANRLLNSLTGLRSGTLRSVGNRLMIRINPQLSACEVTAIRAGLSDNDWTTNDISAANRGCAVCTGAVCTSGAGGLAGQSTVFRGSHALDEDDFTVDQNTPLDLFINVTEVTGDLTVANTPLANLASLSNLTRVRGDFTIDTNSGLANINALNRLTSVGGTLRVAGNAILGNLGGGSNGLVNLTEVGGLYVNGNSNLMNANALSDISVCAGDLLIDNGPVLTTIDLSALAMVRGSFSVSSNDVLTTLSANALEAVGGTLSIYYDAQLSSLSGLSALRSVDGALVIQGNTSLSQCAADALREQLIGWNDTYTSDTNLDCSGTCNGAVCQ